jgi:choline dehydrogenase
MDALDCDFLIVGAGSAGCVLANRLSADPSHRVILLEAGGADSDPLLHVPGAVSRTLATPGVNWGYQSEPEPGLAGRAVPLFRGKVLGGTSTLNGMIYIRGNARDYDDWRQRGCEGWSYDDVLPYFRRSERSERGADAFHGGDGPLEVSLGRPVTPICEAFLAAARAEGYPAPVDFNGATQEGFGHYDVTIHRGKRWSAATAFLKPVMHRENLVVLTRAEATSLLFEGTRVTGAVVVRNERTLRVSAARETLLAGGVFNSPKLLMLSGIGPAEALQALGIPVRVDRRSVGRNLRDHVSYRMNFACRLPVTAYAHTRPLRGAKALIDYALGRRGILAGTSFPTGGFMRSHDDLEIPDLQVGLAMGLLPDPGRMLPSREGFTVTIRQGRPGSVGEIRLRSADPGAAPMIMPRYFSDPGDMPVLMRGVRRLRRVFAQPAIAGLIDHEIEPGQAVVDDNAALEASIRALSNTTHHFIGTCRMGSDSEAVVDPQLRVRGVSGLRVIDASIMPSHINGNTNAPVMMIAEKGADLVLLKV